MALSRDIVCGALVCHGSIAARKTAKPIAREMASNYLASADESTNYDLEGEYDEQDR
jgi:hypothetical protein